MNIIPVYNNGIYYFRACSILSPMQDYIKFDSKNIITKINLEEIYKYQKYQKWIKVFGEFL